MPKTQKIKTVVKKQEGFQLIRIMSSDIPTNKSVYSGLTLIKGISWGLSNAVCHVLKIDRKKKISELKEEDIKKIENFLKNPEIPKFLFNRRKDIETGEDSHLISSDLSLQKEFDVKRLKKIRSYRGLRHALGQPTRGQRTRSHFRGRGRAVGVKKGGKK